MNSGTTNIRPITFYNPTCIKPSSSVASASDNKPSTATMPTDRVYNCQDELESRFSNLNAVAHKSSRLSTEKTDELETLMELGSYHVPLDSTTPDVTSHGKNIIRALADMFHCKFTSLPVIVGLFTEQQPDHDHVSHLATELRNLNELTNPICLQFSILLFIYPLILSIFLGYVAGMLANWQVGLSIGHMAMFVQITFLVVIINGSRLFQRKFATKASHSIAMFLRWLRLVLHVCFCNPPQKLDRLLPVKSIVVYHRLFSSSTPDVALLSMLEKMWSGLIRLHGEIPIRLQRSSNIISTTDRRFKLYLLGELTANAISSSGMTTDSIRLSSNQSINKLVCQTLSDNVHLVHTSIHLPVYLEQPVYTSIEQELIKVSNSTTNMPYSLDGEMISFSGAVMANSMSTSPNGYPHTTLNYKRYKRISPSYAPRANFSGRNSVVTTSPTERELMSTCSNKNKSVFNSRSNSTTSREVQVHGIASLFLKDHELSDWNRKVLKQLVLNTIFTSRILRLSNLTVHIEDLMFWIILTQYWPCHMACLVVYLKDSTPTLTKSNASCKFMVNLSECLQEVKCRVSTSLESLGVLMADDRDLDRLENYLKSKPPMDLNTLKKLISYVLTHNPFIRYYVQSLPSHPTGQSSYADGTFPNGISSLMLTPLKEEMAKNYAPLGMKVMERASGREATYWGTPFDAHKPPNEHIFANPIWTSIDLSHPSDSSGRQNSTSDSLFPHTDPLTNLSQFTSVDICNLISSLPTIKTNRVKQYQQMIIRSGLNGLMLMSSDLDKINQILCMDPNDWRVFSKRITQLRSKEYTQFNRSTTVDADDMETNSLVISNMYPSTCIVNETGPVKQLMHPKLIRQTPWLLSPQVPTGTIVNGKASNDTGESLAPQSTIDKQTSLSDLEEPQSLWKSNTRLDPHKPADPSKRVMKISESNEPYFPDDLRSPSKHPKHMFTSTKDRADGNRWVINRFNSRSTVDLRTAFGPMPNDVSRHYQIGVPNGNVSRYLHCKKYIPKCNPHSSILSPKHIERSKIFCNLSGLDQNYKSETEVQKNPDARVTGPKSKRLCRRGSHKFNSEAIDLNPSNLSAHWKRGSQDNNKRSRSHKCAHPPAISPGQLASLQTFATMTDSSALISDPRNMHLLTPIVPIPFQLPVHCPVDHDIYEASCKPSRKKRARRCDSFNANRQPIFAHIALPQQQQRYAPMDLKFKRNCCTNALELEDDNSENCTCDYLYELDYNYQHPYHHITMSEPTLCNESDGFTNSNSPSPDELKRLSCTVDGLDIDSSEYNSSSVSPAR